MRSRISICVTILALLPAAAARAQVNVGFFGGVAGSITAEGIAGFKATKFQQGTTVYGASLNYRFGNALSLGVRAEQLQMKLSETGSEMGTLKLTPVMVTVGGQGRPSEGRGVTGHVQLGVGMAFPSFATGPWIRDLENSYGNIISVQVQTKKAVIGEFGGGLDYFFTRHVSLTTDFRIVFGNIGTKWSVSGAGISIGMENVDKFYASHWQTLGGLRFWF